MKSRAHVFGHSLHQILIAFPIALLSSSVLFDVLWRVTGDPKWPPMAFYLIELGLAGGLAAALFGFIDYLAIPHSARAKRIGAFHGITSVIVVVIFAGSWALRLNTVAAPPPHAIFLSFCGLAVLGVAGWLGGELVTRFAVGVVDGANLDAKGTATDLGALASESARDGARDGARESARTLPPRPATPLSSSLAEHGTK